MALYTTNSFLEDANGNILLTIEQDQTEVARDVQNTRENGQGWTKDRTMKKAFSVPSQEFYEWSQKLGADCWQDDDFLKFYSKHRPEFAI